MKIHPLFDSVLAYQRLICQDSVKAWVEWSAAGKPVVEEDKESVISFSLEKASGLINPLLDKKLAEKDARIKELEDEKRSLQARLRLDLHLDGRDAGIWNEALEEAAVAAETCMVNFKIGESMTGTVVASPAIAEKIRGLKK